MSPARIGTVNPERDLPVAQASSLPYRRLPAFARPSWAAAKAATPKPVFGRRRACTIRYGLGRPVGRIARQPDGAALMRLGRLRVGNARYGRLEACATTAVHGEPEGHASPEPAALSRLLGHRIGEQFIHNVGDADFLRARIE